jgi:hypothetical protein
MRRTSYFTWKLVAAVALASAPAAAHAEDWQFGLTPYLWLPNIEGDGTAEPPPGGGTPAFEVGPVDYLDNLDFVLMLAGEARRGRWSLRSDVIYIDFSNQRSKVKTVSGPGGVARISPRCRYDLLVHGTRSTGYDRLLAGGPTETKRGDLWRPALPRHQLLSRLGV